MFDSRREIFMEKRNSILIAVLTFGTFAIINTQMGIIGVLPVVSSHFHVSISKAGLLVSLFSLAVAISGPIMPLLFSGVNRKKVMLLVLGIFFLGNIVSSLTSSFILLLIDYVILGFFLPVYCSMALTAAAELVKKEDAPKAVAKVLMGVSAGMVIGVPITSFLANTVSFEISMAFLAGVTAIAILVILLFVPSMPVKERLTYGDQFRILKKPVVWLSIFTVILMNGAVFGVYSYFAEYLKMVTKVPVQMTSIMLFLYGATNLIGNMIAGKLLVKNAVKLVLSFLFALGVVYILLFLMGRLTVPMAVITMLWGILGGISANVNQYWIISAASEAPDLANGLFLTAVNLGTTVGTIVCGLFISGIGTKYVILGGLLLLTASFLTVLARVYRYSTVK